jgi:tetratricopeptide (TPR) repeat protein
LSEALTVARKLNAGQLVWGHVVRVGTSLRPRAELYDLRRPSASVKEILLQDDTPESYSAAATALLAIPDRPTIAAGGDGQTHSYPAWTAYNRGHIALAHWDLPVAEARFAQAVQTDPEFPAARLWLGQITEWRAPLAPDAWSGNAERAAAASRAMTQRDRLLAVALAAMANRTYPAACDAYRQLTALDSHDFVGWYGMGECQGLDRAVIPDRSSPSGWRWRSSYHSSTTAFVRAFGLNPRARALLSYQRLRRLLPVTATNPRTDDPFSPKFAALPSLSSGDTVAFVPYPIAEFTSGLSASATATLNQALNRNLETLLNLVSQWVSASPNDSDAYESLADVLEARGDIREGSDPSASASAAVRKALSLSNGDQQRLRLAAREARLSFKRGDYSRTRAIADSLLVHTNRVDRNDPPVLISLTALTGRVGAMAEQATTQTVPETVDGLAVPPPMRQIAGAFFAQAALGACGESLTALRAQLEQQIESSVADQERGKFRAALTTRPLNMIAPCTGGASSLQIAAPTDRMSKLEQAFGRKDYGELKRRLRAIAQSRRAYRPGDIALDYTYQEAWLKAASGDTAGAILQLDPSLNAIPTMSASALREAGAAAAVGRAMGLRADLAAATGDLKNAKRWGSALAALWTDADPVLQPTVSRMKALASSGR